MNKIGIAVAAGVITGVAVIGTGIVVCKDKIAEGIISEANNKASKAMRSTEINLRIKEQQLKIKEQEMKQKERDNNLERFRIEMNGHSRYSDEFKALQKDYLEIVKNNIK